MKISGSHVVAYDDGGKVYSFAKLCRQVHLLNDYLKNNHSVSAQKNVHNNVLVSCNSTYHFLVATLGILLAGKRVVILPNALQGTLQQYKDAYNGIVDEDFLATIPSYLHDDDLQHHDDENNKNDVINKKHEQKPIELDISSNAEIVFYTSGSTGNPSKIIKKFSSLWAEVTDTTQLSGIDECSIVASTVPHHHMYGFLFKVLGPLFAQKPFFIPIIRFPDDMKELKDFMLVSSPAFLSRLDESDSITGCNRIISSGGPLSLIAGNNAEKIFNASGIEVYGSTETGGIAYRKFSAEKSFFTLPGVIAKSNHFGQLEIKSAYMNEPDWYLCNDFVAFKEASQKEAASKEIPSEKTYCFEVIGRSDDVIKIEEKRISLAEIQNRLLSSFAYIERVYVFPFETPKRKKLAALVIKKKDFHALDTQVCIDEMTTFLLRTIDPIFVPKNWKVINEFDTGDMGNEMGKVSRSKIMEVFFEKNPDVNINEEVADNA